MIRNIYDQNTALNHLSQKRTSYSPVLGLGCYWDSDLQNRTCGKSGFTYMYFFNRSEKTCFAYGESRIIGEKLLPFTGLSHSIYRLKD